MAQVPASGQPQLLCSHDLRAQLQRSLSAPAVTLLRIAGVPGGALRAQPAAVLASSTPENGRSERVPCFATSLVHCLFAVWTRSPLAMAAGVLTWFADLVVSPFSLA